MDTTDVKITVLKAKINAMALVKTSKMLYRNLENVNIESSHFDFLMKNIELVEDELRAVKENITSIYNYINEKTY